MRATQKQINIRDIKESPVNAHQMSDKEFYRLVRNLKRDGCLTSSVLLMETDGEKLMCISGHHRIKACVKAEIKEVPAIVIENLNDADRVRLQLSHNDIKGFDDAYVLQELIKELPDEMYEFINTDGIDLDIEPLEDEETEEQPDYRYVNLCFLPDTEKEFEEILDEISTLYGSKVIVSEEDYPLTKELLTKAHRAGFKSPGQAFRKFIDIVKDSIELQPIEDKEVSRKKDK